MASQNVTQAVETLTTLGFTFDQLKKMALAEARQYLTADSDGTYSIGDRKAEMWINNLARLEANKAEMAARSTEITAEGDYRWVKTDAGWAITGSQLVEGVTVIVRRAGGTSSIETLGRVYTHRGTSYAFPTR